MWIDQKKLHELFHITLFFKAFNGIIEILGGILLFFISNDMIYKVTEFIFRGELVEDPKDVMISHLVYLAQNLSIATKVFIAFYLLANGVVKVLLVYSLWQDKEWAFPVAGVILAAIIAYDAYRMFVRFSYFLLFLLLIDIVIVFLLKNEYEHFTKNRKIRLRKK